MNSAILFFGFCLLAMSAFFASQRVRMAFGYLGKNAPDGDYLIGRSFRIKGVDTVVTEEIKIYLQG